MKVWYVHITGKSASGFQLNIHKVFAKYTGARSYIPAHLQDSIYPLTVVLKELEVEGIESE